MAKCDRTKQSGEIFETARKKLMQGHTEEALVLLQRIEDSEPKAIFLMGVIYYDGMGVMADMKRGIEYMKKIAEMKDLTLEEQQLQAEAFYNLGMEYYSGMHVPKDNKEAERYWLQGARIEKTNKNGKAFPGTVKSQTSLGMFYLQLKFRDMKKVYYWHNKASNNESAQSKGALGVMYLYGIEVEEDHIRAYKFLLEASIMKDIYAQGYLTAFYFIRGMYHKAIDMGELVSEYENLEELALETGEHLNNVKTGVAVGCYYLGLCYQFNHGLHKKDLNKTTKLIKRAASLCPSISKDLHVKAILGID